MRVGLYIHVPFCLRKCYYCDFTSLPVGDHEGERDAFASAVCREMALAARMYVRRGPFTAPTLYFGGGTPSLLTPACLSRILDAAREHFGLEPDAEITLEGNPGTIDADNVFAFRALGINRFSLGIQSFDDGLLRALGRAHTAAQGLQAVQLLRGAGFTNINIDLMFALPGQTLQTWRESLRMALDLRPEHLSAYSLIIEEGTPFAVWERQGKLARPDEDEELAMFEAAMEQATDAGYEHYEISSFALPGYRCAHNLIYWRGEPYLGFGPSAASTIDDARTTNTSSLTGYLDAIAQDRLPVDNAETIARETAMGEMMMLGLRLREGVEQARFAARFGIAPSEAYPDAIRKLTSQGLLHADSERLALTPRGLLLANNAMAEFLA